MGWIDEADRWVVERLQTLHDPALDAFFRWLSTVPFRLAVLAVGLGLAAWLLRNPRRLAGAFLAAGAALLVNWGLTHALKEVIGRPRPPASDPAIHPLVPVPGDPSLPSGHASSAFAAAVALAVLLPRRRWPLLLVALAIAFSRVWLGVHYPSDVIAGALLGAAVGFLCARAVAARLGDRADVGAVHLDRGPAHVRGGGRE